MTRIVQAANFVSPHSGGIRTTLEALGHLLTPGAGLTAPRSSRRRRRSTACSRCTA